MEKKLKSNKIYSGRVFDITVDEVLLSNGRTTTREKVHHNGGACVLAITDDGMVPLVRQFRYGAGCELLEIPAGKLESGEDPEECAKRELAEECGLGSPELVSLGKIYPTAAYCGEAIHLFLANGGLEKTNACPDDNEILRVEYVPLERLAEMCRTGEVDDAKTIAAVFRAGVLTGSAGASLNNGGVSCLRRF
jgi:ADP-ribose pyrophosphatase